jgi:N-acetyl-alpha-D-glucosaminyl L-malate synthase BshA
VRIGISCYPTWGGSGVVATELAMALAAGGDDVHVISYARPTRLEFTHPRLSYHEVIVPHYPLFEYPPYSLALATQIVALARHQKLDLIHVHYAVPNAVSAVLAREILAPQPLKVVTTLHGTDITLVGNDPSYLETTRFGIARSDAVTAVSQDLKKATREKLGIENSIDVIPNFIEPQRFERVKGQPGAHQWTRKDEKVMVHISNFRPVKRVMDVVAIFHQVYQQIPQSHLVLVGDGPDRAKVEQYCRDSGICHAITFVGSLPSVEEVLAGADLFLLPSETESFGLAALEALSCEVPVIATDVGGIPEVVQHGVHGYLHPVGAVDEMAKSAIELLTNDALLHQFGKEGRRWAIEQFSQDRIVAQYREIYQRVLA